MSITTLFESGLYGRLRQQAGSHWQDYVDHPFLQQLAAGTLPERAFRRYLTRDYLFLLHFARAYALLVSKLRTLPEMRAATASLNGIVAELPLHVAYCAEWGLNEAQIAAQPEAAETMNYTRYVLDIGHAGDALDLLAGLLPCVAGYAEIGLRLLHDPPPKWRAILTPPDPQLRRRGLSGRRACRHRAAGNRRPPARRTGPPHRVGADFHHRHPVGIGFWQMGLNAS